MDHREHILCVFYRLLVEAPVLPHVQWTPGNFLESVVGPVLVEALKFSLSRRRRRARRRRK
jgi:hypothetical protein